ncbi:MAG: twin-arginine translocase TatA/TatE family subunit [Chloroflexi bacterium]|nr:twin-arginine translocase TatA/TatE family subunit [Chloroflexota bacterium]
MPRIGPMELVIILVILLVIFGVGKLPQVGGAMGKAIREFRKGQSEVEAATRSEEEGPAAAPSPTPSSAKPSEDEEPARRTPNGNSPK